MSWDKSKKKVRGSWVLRDAKADVILHCQRSFVEAICLEDAKLICIKWAMDSIHSHRFNRVIFVVEDVVLVGATTRPKVWPSFGYQTSIILESLVNFLDWKLENVSRCANKRAFFIAQTVTKDDRSQSYVALGFSEWLVDVF